MFKYISTRSDEAMLFLILANNWWVVWTKMAIDLASKPKEPTPKHKTVQDCQDKQRYYIDGKSRGYLLNARGKGFYNLLYNAIIEID